MKRVLHVITVVAVATALLVLSAGCQSDNDPPPDQEPSRSPAERLPTPSDELPRMPSKATEKSEAGGLAFGKYYYALINYGRATGDWGPAKDVTADSCTECGDFWAKNPKRMDNNLSIRFEREPSSARFVGNESSILFLASSDKNISNVLRHDREAWNQVLRLKYREGGWQVVDLESKRSLED